MIGWGSGRGTMVESWILALAVWNALCLAVAVLWLDLRVSQYLDDLDVNLATAIKGVIDAARGAVEGAEPFNPIQAAIAQWISGQIGGNQKPPDISLLDRSPKGQFTPKNPQPGSKDT